MTSSLGAFPHLGYADYAALRAGVMSGEVTQIAIRLSQLDTGDSDDDGAVFIIPNMLGILPRGSRQLPCVPGVEPWR